MSESEKPIMVEHLVTRMTGQGTEGVGEWGLRETKTAEMLKRIFWGGGFEDLLSGNVA